MKKIIVYTLILFMLCACSSKSNYDDSSAYDIEDYTYDKSDLVIDNKFIADNGLSIEDYEGYVWHNDNQNEDNYLPLRFRTTQDDFIQPKGKYNLESNYVPSTKGFKELNISGSSQFNTDQFDALQEKLNSLTNKNIYIVDLRQESHFILNGEESVCWYGLNNWSNLGKDLKQVNKEESDISDNTEGTTITIGDVDSDGYLSGEYDVYVESLVVEKEYVESKGYNYVRFAATDHVWPQEDVVDNFIEFVKSLPRNTWLHFHCEAGKGRTTTFMYMYDVMKNPDVSLKDISYRQCMIGGTYMFYEGESEPESDNWMVEYYQEKSDMAGLFYDYVQENHSNNFKTSWSEWLKDNK